jgi:hypothetical protein
MNIASEAAFETVIEGYLLQHGYEQVPRAAPEPGPFCKFTHPYPNLPIRDLWGPPRIPPALRQCTADNRPKTLTPSATALPNLTRSRSDK